MQLLTRDHFLNGNVVIYQPKSGYRFSIDAVILAHMACPGSGETVLDLGTGCGVVSVMLAFRHPDLRLIGVEIQPALSKLARRNVEVNGMTERIHIIEKDMGQLSLADVDRQVDLVVTNPPYRKRSSGRIAADSQRAVARHELKTDLKTVLQAARRVLRRSGRLVIIYPTVRTVDLLSAMRAEGLEPKSLKMIHTDMSSSARLVVVSGVKDGRPGIVVEPPFFLYDEKGFYTPAADAFFS